MRSALRFATLFNAAGMLLLYWVFAYRFNLSLIFDNTILTGGDSISWHQVALHLRNTLLPDGRLYGWDLDNFFGYANFLGYFIPPFLLAAALSYVMPLAIALKLVSLLGIAATPLAVFYTLKKLRYPDPLPLAGSWLILLFLFNEHYNIFGGNISSTLAGEFCFSIAFALQILFIGSLHDTMHHNRNATFTSVLLALIGLTHAMVFFSALFLPLYYAFKKDFSQLQLRNLAYLYFFAFLMMAFWVIPMLANREFVVSILMVWHFFSWQQFYEQFWGAILLLSAFAGTCVLFPAFRRYHATFYMFGMAIAFFLYLAAPLLKIADIRFYPAFLLFGFLLIFDNLACIALWMQPVARQRAARFSLMIFFSAIATLTISRDDLLTPAWFNWNYGGYETTPGFVDGTMQQLQTVLRGDLSDGRVAWEQLPQGDRYGGARIFENLTMLTGRAGTEGINYGSSMLGKIITVLHSEYSPHATSPESIIYSHIDIDRLAERFRLFNITDFIANSATTKQKLDASSDFTKVSDVAEFSIYKIKPYQNRYVETPAYYPQLVELDKTTWQKHFHAWFRRAEKQNVLLVNGYYSNAKNRDQYFTDNVTTLNAFGMTPALIQKPVPDATITNTRMDHMRIMFTTDKPGLPHLIKVAYSPNWYSLHDEPVFMVSPGLMLMFPKTAHVELRYGRHWTEILGYALSVFGIVFMLALKFGKPGRLNRLWLNAGVTRVVATVFAYRKHFLITLSLSVIIIGIIGAMEKQTGYPLLERGQALAAEHQYAESIATLERLTSVDNIRDYDDLYLPPGLFALAEIYLKTGDVQRAVQTIQKFIHYYPNWEFIDKVYFLLGESLTREHDNNGALRAYTQCLSIQSESGYRERCQAALDSLKKGNRQ